MANSGNVKFVDNSQSAKDGLLDAQYKALKEASSEAVKIVRDKAPKRKKKRLMYNIQARTYTRRKYGFVVAHIGVLDKAHSKKVPYAGFYAHAQEFGTSETPAQPFLKPGVIEAIPIIRDTVAKRLAEFKNSQNTEDEENTTNL